MQDNDVLYEIEKTIGGSVREIAGQSAPPPFADITGRIAAGQPPESFEEFFAEDLPAAPTSHAGSRQAKFKIIAGAAAAALVLFVGGGTLLGAIFDGSLAGTRTAADSADCTDYANYACINETGACEEDEEKCVSDSDLIDSDASDPSDTSQ